MCTKCHKLIDPEVARENRMKCSCGGTIKKGVDYRISEIADSTDPVHPEFRPDYIHLMPLAEIISAVYGKGVTTKHVQGIWQKLIDNFKTEIDVLINTPLEDIKKVDLEVSQAIESFRNNTIDVVPGGGGQYGQILFKKEIKKPKVVTLDNF